MYRSVADVALVPLAALVTVTSKVPADAGGDRATIRWGVSTRNNAGSVPNCTELTPVKLFPTMNTSWYPVVGPDFGKTFRTIGAFVVGV
jgi:hypothetical protein